MKTRHEPRAKGGKGTGLPTEAQEQSNLFLWMEYMTRAHPELNLCFHIANGGTRDRIEARHLKEQGVKPGVPDLLLPVPRAGLHGLFVELKRQKGGRVSPEQRAWIHALNAQGYRAVVAYGFEDARQKIIDYLEGR